MQDIAMSLLDIVQNSLRAKALHVYISIKDSVQDNIISIEVKDDGIGMDETTLKKVTNPFYTSRTTRDVGLGVPLFQASVEATGGKFLIESTKNKGTKIVGEYIKNHIDTPPMGDLVSTMITFIQYDEHIDYVFFYQCDTFEFYLDTSEIKKILDGVPINEPDILVWLKEYIKKGMKA